MAEIVDFRKPSRAGTVTPYRPTAPYVVGMTGPDRGAVALCLADPMVDLTPAQARGLAGLLVRYANAIEDGQGELDLGEGDEPDEAV
jgi:hypothetical protein